MPKKINESGFHPEAGVKKGLTVILDAHTDLIKVNTMSIWISVDVDQWNVYLQASSVREDFQGFIAVIGERESYPLTNQASNHIQLHSK